MPLLDRTRIWRTAWGLLPLAMLVNVWLNVGIENELRLQQQGHANGVAERWDEAADQFERAARAAPGSASAAYNAAVAHQMQGDLKGAAEWNAQALQRDPNLAPALQQRELLRQRRSGRRQPGAAAGERP